MPEPDLTLVIDVASAIPVYRQIVDQIRHWLVTGALMPGASLPSVRRLAIDLGIHHNTIAEAYRALADEGWLDVSHGRAARVLERVAPAPERAAERRELQGKFSRRLKHLIAEMRSSGLQDDWIATELRSNLSFKDF